MAKRVKGLNQIYRDLDGEPVIQVDQLGSPILGEDNKPKTLNARDMLSATIGRGQSEDPIHSIDVALKIRHSNEHVQLDDVDITLLEKAVKADRQSSDLAKAFLLRIIGAAKPEEEKKEG